MIKMRKLTFVQHCSLNYIMNSEFTTFPQTTSQFSDPIQDPALRLFVGLFGHLKSKRLPQSFFTFQTLALLKNAAQLLCRMSLTLGWSDIFPWLEWSYAFLGKNTQK